VALALALPTALFAIFAALRGRGGERRWVDLSRRAAYALCALLTLCVVLIEVAFVGDDFSLAVVANHSSIDTPTLYKFGAMWSSQQGSLLLWAWVLSVAASAALYATRNRLRELVPYATAVMMGVAVFFVGLMLFGGGVNPFSRISPVPPDGAGLNPLLQHPSMMIHPPMLYSGYVAFTVPFAFAIGALITRRLGAEWIRATRSFALIAWALLGLGLLLGARWSYTELGWGGYWAWDPVENAALMPWLIGTAFLHSAMVQEKRGMLKTWNASLIVATFALSLLGTFLVRSGVLQSIHAFGDSTVGPYILGLIAVVLVGSTALVVSRREDLRSPRRIDSLASREAIFLVNNLLLVGLTAIVFWGTFFPLISELFTGREASLAAPWFDRYTTPLAVALVLFTGVGPLLAWRRMSWASARRVFAWPLAVGAAAGVVLITTTDATGSPWALGLFALASFTFTALGQELWRAATAQRSLAGGRLPAAALAVVARNRRRWGGYLVHAGIATMLIGIAASSSFQTSRDVTLRPGQSAEVSDYRVTYERPTVAVDDEAISFGAMLDVRRDGEPFAALEPTRRYFRPGGARVRTIRGFFQGEATSEVGLKAGLRSDFWTAVQPRISGVVSRARSADERFRALMSVVARQVGENPGQAAGAARFAREVQERTVARVAATYAGAAMPATFRVIVNPLASWLFIGGAIALAGALIAVWPTSGPKRTPVAASEKEARKQAKYREIRDAELDHAAGKLDDEDFRLLDAELRREAVEILDEADGRRPEKTPG